MEDRSHPDDPVNTAQDDPQPSNKDGSTNTKDIDDSTKQTGTGDSSASNADVDMPLPNLDGQADDDSFSARPSEDLVGSIVGMCRILDLVAEQSSGGLGWLFPRIQPETDNSHSCS